MKVTNTNRPKIVILGAGYGGMMTTVKLQKMLHINDATITLVNKNHYHYQTTWLHENAAGTRHHDDTRINIHHVINHRKVSLIKDTVISVDPNQKKVVLENNELFYDILVIALGFEAAMYDIPGLKENAFTIGDINKARLIREHMEYNFAMYHNHERKKQRHLHIVVGGGGFTGVEFLGELANRIPKLCKEYDIDPELVKIINIERYPTILNGFHPQLVEYAMGSLEARGVEFITGAIVKKCTPNEVIYEKGGEIMSIPTNTVIWTAGVKANTIINEMGFETKFEKVKVQKDMRIPGYDNVFVLGDCALIMNEHTKRPYPPTAQLAIQESAVVAQNIKTLIKHKSESELTEFVPKVRGTVASLGRHDAISDMMHNRTLFGLSASIMKKFIDNRYLFRLGGIRLLIKKGKFNIFE